MNTSILSCKNLSYTIGYKKIFKNISFEIFASDFTLLTGENGSGKSSLLSAIFKHPNYNIESGKITRICDIIFLIMIESQ
jgi:ABC-type cobalamin/Fe3+-siderophores transport system ATPase subunit